MSHNVQAVVLAGGTSERFQTKKTKLIEKICGKEMIIYPLQLLQNLNIQTSLVLGYQHELITDVLNKYQYADMPKIIQEKNLGSGHAAALSKAMWSKDHILLMGADTPLLNEDVITKLYNKHVKTDSDISFITAHGIDTDNKNFCRIIINDNKIHVLDNSESIQDLESQCCISGGVYIAKKSFLEKYIDELTQGSINNEYYLPELIQIASNNNCKIVTSPVSIDTIRCVDTLADLWAVEHIKRSQIIRHWMEHGVRVANALTVMIDEQVIIKPGAYIGSGVHLIGNTTIEENSSIGAYSYIKNSTVEKNCNIKSHVVVTNSIITANSTIQPFNNIADQKSKSSNNKVNSTTTFTGALKTEDIDNTHNL